MRLLEALPVLPDHLPRTCLERHELVPLDIAWDAADRASLSFGPVVDRHKTDKATSQAYVRRAPMRLPEALPVLPAHLPRTWLERHELVPLDMAWRAAHCPDDEGELRDAMRRLK